MRSTVRSQTRRSYGSSQANSISSLVGSECHIVAVGKRRDGGKRYWCLRHKADATEKYGRRATACRASHFQSEDVTAFDLDLDKYRGGIALWGAVPAVYDTTRLPLDQGIHVHARSSKGQAKAIDRTFAAVRIVGSCLPIDGLEVSAVDAIYYMVSSVFDLEMKQVLCTHCGHTHLDRDWFSVHPHRRHLCASCGRYFSDIEKAVGNPICGLREPYGVRAHEAKPAKRQLNIRQSDYLGGLQIWGSNPAFIWTSPSTEEEGIHVHAFREDESHPFLDDTYSQVTIDGVKLAPTMVRIFMAQNALPHLRDRIKSIECPNCREQVFSMGELAITPIAEHPCARCGKRLRTPGRLRKTVGNPLPEILERLAQHAPRQPQKHVLDLLPETL